MEVDAVSSNLAKIREQAELAMTVMNLHLDSLEETFKDSFWALNVDGISAKLTSLEGTLMAFFHGGGEHAREYGLHHTHALGHGAG
jgi:hypothetical protein